MIEGLMDLKRFKKFLNLYLFFIIISTGRLPLMISDLAHMQVNGRRFISDGIYLRHLRIRQIF